MIRRSQISTTTVETTTVTITSETMREGFLRPEEVTFLAGLLVEGGEYIKWTQLYDGAPCHYSLEEFHEKTRGQAPIVAIATNASGYMFGACTHVKLAADNSWVEEAGALLFLFRGKDGVPCHRQYAAKAGIGVLNTEDVGLCFGSNNEQDVAFLTRDGHLHIKDGASFNIDDISTFCGDDFEFVDFKVYRIDEVCRTLIRPWRPDIKWTNGTLRELTDEVVRYRPIDESGLDKVNILLVGPVKAGKSSFFNSVNSAIRRIITGQANTGSAVRSLTTTFRKYPVRLRTGGERLNFRLCDSMGLEDDKGLEAADYNYILDGNLRDGYEFNTFAGITDKDEKYRQAPDFKHKMHVTVIAIDANYIEICGNDSATLKKLKFIRKNSAQRGIPVLLLLTKVDLICRETENDLSNVYRSRAVAERVQKTSSMMGIPKKDIVVVKNYECETDCDDNVDILILTALRQMLRRADDCVHNEMDTPTAR